MEQFFLLQDKDHVKNLFQKYADKGKRKIVSVSNFSAAIDELGLILESEGRDLLFKEADMDNDNGLDLEEFSRVINKTSKLEQWATTLPLAKLLAYCLPSLETGAVNSTADSLRAVSRLSTQDIVKAAQLVGEGVARVLEERVKDLKACYDNMDKKTAEELLNTANVKFQAFTMSAGKVEDFHKGLTERVGE